MRRWLLYTIGGAATYSLKLGISAVLVELGDVVFSVAYAITTAVVVVFSYWYNRRITFQSQERPVHEFRTYLLVLALFYALDFALTVFLTAATSVAYPFAITAVTAFLFVAKFPVFRHVVFRPAA